jgi:hypothetical protein
MPISEIKRKLGKPTNSFYPSSLQIELGVDEADIEYTKNGATLSISYNISSLKFESIFVSINSDNASISDYMTVCNVTDIETMKNKVIRNRNGVITGIHFYK